MDPDKSRIPSSGYNQTGSFSIFLQMDTLHVQTIGVQKKSNLKIYTILLFQKEVREGRLGRDGVDPLRLSL